MKQRVVATLPGGRKLTSEPKPRVTPRDACACVHLACAHAPGKCPDVPVRIDSQLGTRAALCEACAEQWGFPAESPKRLSEEELSAIESALLDLRRTIAAGEFFEAERILRRPSLDATTVSRLIVEVRRLRTLVKDAAPYFDGMEADARGRGHEREIRQLQVRLRAEVTEGELD